MLAFTLHRSVVKKLSLGVARKQLPLRVGRQAAQQAHYSTGEAHTGAAIPSSADDWLACADGIG
ncbi:MAG: hypothetical protein EBW49_02890 [Betaproteobacteria bacterium]|nr:hypothetical protein [Betaproteobacteria bacterium]